MLRPLYLVTFAVLLSTLALSCAVTGPGCDELAASGDTTAAVDDEGDPCGLSCNEHGGCNSDYPYCCNGACQKTPCSSAGRP